MTKAAELVLKKALELDDSERAEIAGALLSSLEPEPEADIEAAWREEVRRRVDEIESGQAELVPWEEVRERLFSRLHDRS